MLIGLVKMGSPSRWCSESPSLETLLEVHACVNLPLPAATLRRARILSSNCVTSSRPTVKALGDCDAAGDPRGTSVIRTRGNFLAGILPEPLAAAVRSIEAAPMSTVGA